ncbi:hypothetical protein T552_01724 [Pneumocystis carinii B80]|uniref:Protein kinase domain-containing protein n=1 Tax=Pneumocystis carinii (strain B80) TaxID=1408658 RepID=A0A0W4ZJB9_PNEC8|nr:hypothetical protein T552_01724 [Pneumocystis carinii B80]KTW28463.1 hypothetical protein T552_01724 [Pneumocystis carinii B80]
MEYMEDSRLVKCEMNDVSMLTKKLSICRLRSFSTPVSRVPSAKSNDMLYKESSLDLPSVSPVSTMNMHSSKRVFFNDRKSRRRIYNIGDYFKKSKNLSIISFRLFSKRLNLRNHLQSDVSTKNLLKHEDEKVSNEKGAHVSHSLLDLKHFFRSHHDHLQLNTQESLRQKKHSLFRLKSRKFEASFKNKYPAFSHKYEKYGKPVGSGTGGSVRLLSSCDGTVYAVKEFRKKALYESGREYRKKVSAEFCVGSALHHPNIIQTLDFVSDGSRYYEIMEYAPYDMFSIVMSGKLTREEIYCCTKQILQAVDYIHSLGLAHRDLKLDNLVMNENGIVKLIDFGSAIVFRYSPKNFVKVSGIVGSDPYLAPEVCTEEYYNPQPADIWSVAIIFCCMVLCRFPWKKPRISDGSFREFAMGKTETGDNETENLISAPTVMVGEPHLPNIRGPWRLLMLLPRETRLTIQGMLEINSKCRWTMEQIMEQPWIKSVEMCYINSNNDVVKAKNHVHTLLLEKKIDIL